MPACVYMRVCVCGWVLLQRCHNDTLKIAFWGFPGALLALIELPPTSTWWLFNTRSLTHTHMKTYTHLQRARHYQHQRQSNSKHHSLTHSLIHSFIRSRSQRVTPRHVPPSLNQSLTLVVASFPSPFTPSPLTRPPRPAIANERHPSPRITHQLITSQATKSSRAEVKRPTRSSISHSHSPRIRRKPVRQIVLATTTTLMHAVRKY